jgi:PPM family protein phosphatase
MRWEQSVKYASRSDIGFRRENNQDSLSVQICQDRAAFESHGHLFLVADGMGGHAVGELASKIAADTIPHTFYKSRAQSVPAALKDALEVANRNIFERGSHNREFERMGTTCSALVLSPAGAVIAHVGDSRVYRVRGDRIDQLTFDHSLQWELLRQGRMRPDEIFLFEPRHVITRSLGPDESVQVDVEGPYAVMPGDTYVLCSDGLTNHVKDDEIGTIAGELPPGEASRLLVNLANLRGGSDNVTVVIARAGDLPAGMHPVEIAPAAVAQAPVDWRWLAAGWGAGIGIVLGISLILLQYAVQGVLVLGAALIGLVAFVLNWLRTPRALASGGQPGEETILWRPYRTADARLTRGFLNQLAAIESEMQRTAVEEGWNVDWKVHEAEFQEVKNALASSVHHRAFRALARAIDLLMGGLQEQRRKVQHERRWGRVASSPSDTNE